MNPTQAKELQFETATGAERLAQVGDVTVEIEGIEIKETLSEPAATETTITPPLPEPAMSMIDFPPPGSPTGLPGRAFELIVPSRQAGSEPVTTPSPRTTAHHAHTIERRLGRPAL